MKPRAIFALAFFLLPLARGADALFPSPAPSAEKNGYVDDGLVSSRIEEALQKIIDSGSFAHTDTFIAQLRERKNCELKNLPQPRAEKISPAEIYRRNLAGCLIVAKPFKCKKCGRWHETHAGAIALTDDGVIATNYHVAKADDAPLIAAVTSGGKIYIVTEVLAASESDDAAILKIDTHGEKLTPIALEAVTPVGSTVTLISSPRGRFFTLSTGLVSRYFLERNRGTSVPRVAVTADYAQGSSGSPLFNESGNIAAMVCSTQSIYTDGKNNARGDLQMVVKNCVPAESILKLIRR